MSSQEKVTSAVEEEDEDNHSVDSFELISEMNSLINLSNLEAQEAESLQESQGQGKPLIQVKGGDEVQSLATIGTFLTVNEAQTKTTIVETDEKTEQLDKHETKDEEKRRRGDKEPAVKSEKDFKLGDRVLRTDKKTSVGQTHREEMKESDIGKAMEGILTSESARKSTKKRLGPKAFKKKQECQTGEFYNKTEVKNELCNSQVDSKSSAQLQEMNMTPSTSKPSEKDCLGRKFPVVLLEKLDEGITAMKVKETADKTVDTNSEKQSKKATSHSSQKGKSKSEAKKSAWYDADAPLSDISVSDISLSDSEDLVYSPLPEGGKASLEKPVRRTERRSEKGGSDNKRSDTVRTTDDEAGSKEQRTERRSDRRRDRTHKTNTDATKRGETLKDSSTSESVRDEKATGEKKIETKKRDSRKESSHKDRTEREKDGQSKEWGKSKENDSFTPSFSASKSQSSQSKAEKEEKGLRGDDKKGENTHNVTNKHRSRRSSIDGSHRSNKRQHSGDSSTSESAKIKKVTEETVETATSIPKSDLQEMKESTEKVSEKKNMKYELCLEPVFVSDLANASFRKFINLASDCSVYFKKKHSSSLPKNGNVVLYFGDLLGVQSAMQRLCQLPELTNKWVNGCIKYYEIQLPRLNESKDQWKKVLSARLCFEFCANKADKLQQLIPLKDRKKEGIKRKSADIYRIPSSMTQEMLSLLFPFSLGINFSDSGLQNRGLRGPVEVEFESQEWMEAVLICFRSFAIYTKTVPHKAFYLRIKNFMPPQEKTEAISSHRDSPVSARQSKTNSSKGYQSQKDESSSRNPGIMKERSNDARGRDRPEMNRSDQRKRPLLDSNISQRLPGSKDTSPQKRPKYDGTVHSRSPIRPLMTTNISGRNDQLPRQPVLLNPPQQPGQLNPTKDAVRNLAISQGLDPNNQDVIKILEMTTQLEALQSLVMQQTAHASSLGITGLAAQQGIARDQPQEARQAWGMQQSRDMFEAMKRQEARQALGTGLVARSQESNFWPKLPINEECDIDKAESMLKGNIASRLKQLEDLQMKMKSNKEQIERRAEQRKNDWTPKSRDSFSPAFETRSPRHTFGLPAEARRTDSPLIRSLGSGSPATEFSSSPALHLRRDQSSTGSPFTTSFASGKSHDKSPFMKHNPNDELEHLSHRSSSLGRNYSHKSPHSRETSVKETGGNGRDERRSREGKNRNNTIHQGQPERTGTRWNPETRDETLDPSCNDTPLNFNKLPPSMTTEQAVRQDTARTIEAHLQQRVIRPSKSPSERNKPFVKRNFNESEVVSLPVHFGKNAVKKTPKQFEEEEKKAEEQTRRMAREKNRESFIKNQNLNRGGSRMVGNVEKLLNLSGSLGAKRRDDSHHEHGKIPLHEGGFSDSRDYADREERDGIYNIKTQVSNTLSGPPLNSGMSRRGQTRMGPNVSRGASRPGNFQRGAILGENPQHWTDSDETNMELQEDTNLNQQQRDAMIKRGPQRGRQDLRQPRGRFPSRGRGGLSMDGGRTSDPTTDFQFDDQTEDYSHNVPSGKGQMNPRGRRGTGRPAGNQITPRGDQWSYDEGYGREQPYEGRSADRLGRDIGQKDNLDHSHHESPFTDPYSEQEQFEEYPPEEDCVATHEKEDPWHRSGFGQEYRDQPRSQRRPPGMQGGQAHRLRTQSGDQGDPSYLHGKRNKSSLLRKPGQDGGHGRKSGELSGYSNAPPSEFEDSSAPITFEEHQEWDEEFEEHSDYNRGNVSSRDQRNEDFQSNRGRGGYPRHRGGRGGNSQEVRSRNNPQQLEMKRLGGNAMQRPERGRGSRGRGFSSASSGPDEDNSGFVYTEPDPPTAGFGGRGDLVSGRDGPGKGYSGQGSARGGSGLGYSGRGSGRGGSGLGHSGQGSGHGSHGPGQGGLSSGHANRGGPSFSRGGRGQAGGEASPSLGHTGAGHPRGGQVRGRGVVNPANAVRVGSSFGASGPGHGDPDQVGLSNFAGSSSFEHDSVGPGGPVRGRGGPVSGRGGAKHGHGGPASGRGGASSSRGGPASSRGGPASSRGGAHSGRGGPIGAGRGPVRGRPIPVTGQTNQNKQYNSLLPTPDERESFVRPDGGYGNVNHNFKFANRSTGGTNDSQMYPGPQRGQGLLPSPENPPSQTHTKTFRGRGGGSRFN